MSTKTTTDTEAKKPATVEEQIKLAAFKGKLEKPVRAILDADLFLRAYSAVSTEETRYYLNGVHIEPAPDGGVLMIATDGHRLLCIRDAKGFYAGDDERGAIIRALPHFRALASKPKRASASDRFFLRDYKIVVMDNIMALVELTAGTTLEESGRAALFEIARKPNKMVLAIQTSDVLIDGTFPDWRRVVPILDHDAVPGMIDQKILSGLAAALTSNPTQSLGVRLTTGCNRSVIGARGTDGDPILVRANSAGIIDGFGIIMPMRSDKSAMTYPAWMKIERMAERDERLTAEAEARAKKLVAEAAANARKVAEAAAADKAATKTTFDAVAEKMKADKKIDQMQEAMKPMRKLAAKKAAPSRRAASKKPTKKTAKKPARRRAA